MSAQSGVNDNELRARIERLESLARPGGGGGGGAAVSFAGPIVANQLAATALPASTYVTSRQVYTIAQEAIWQYIPGIPGTVGVPPLVADEVIAAAGGVLARTEYSSPKWRTGVNDVFIDPANPLASNENDGFTAATPLLTGYELHRRWGWNSSKPIVGCNFATSPDGFLNIHVMSDLVTPDFLPLKFTVAREVSIRIVSPLLPANILRTATLTDAVITQNPAVPLGGTRLTIRDNTLAGWGIAETFNRRVRFLDGPAGPNPGLGLSGGTLQPQTDAVATPGQVQCSSCQQTNEAGFDVTPHDATPAVGDTYVIEKLVVVNLGVIDIDQEINSTFGGFDVFVNFVDINLPSLGLNSGPSWVPRTQAGLQGPFLNFYQCTIDRVTDVSLSQLLFIACYGTAGVVGQGSGKFNPTLSGGGWNAVPTSFIQIVFGSGSVESAINFDCVINKAIIVGLTQAAKNFAVWNATPAGGVNAGGHGVVVGFGGASPFFGQRGEAMFKGLVWGNSNPGAGILVGAGCNGVGPPQNITGALGDFKLADNPVVGAAVYYNAATSTYLPVGGQTTSWALLAAAKGAPGFGGGALWPDQQSNWVAAETTA